MTFAIGRALEMAGSGRGIRGKDECVVDGDSRHGDQLTEKDFDDASTISQIGDASTKLLRFSGGEPRWLDKRQDRMWQAYRHMNQHLHALEDELVRDSGIRGRLYGARAAVGARRPARCVLDWMGRSPVAPHHRMRRLVARVRRGRLQHHGAFTNAGRRAIWWRPGRSTSTYFSTSLRTRSRSRRLRRCSARSPPNPIANRVSCHAAISPQRSETPRATQHWKG
jgi:hypothetical protein